MCWSSGQFVGFYLPENKQPLRSADCFLVDETLGDRGWSLSLRPCLLTSTWTAESLNSLNSCLAWIMTSCVANMIQIMLVWFEVSWMQHCVGVMVKTRFSGNHRDWLSDSESIAVGEAAKRCVNVTPLHAWLDSLAACTGVISCRSAAKSWRPCSFASWLYLQCGCIRLSVWEQDANSFANSTNA